MRLIYALKLIMVESKWFFEDFYHENLHIWSGFAIFLDSEKY